MPRLDIRVFGKWVGIIPKARRTVATAKPPRKAVPEQAQGRVDITDELKRYVLYRLREGDQDVWVVDAPENGYDVETSWYIPMSQTNLLTQESFEKALMSYLR